MNLDNDDIKFKSLEKAHYCPKIDEDTKDNFIETFSVENFDVAELKKLTKNSVALLSHSKAYRLLIIEILDVLNNYKYDFLVYEQKYITFYWSGIPVLEICINQEVKHNNQLHISLQRYKETKATLIQDKKTNRLLNVGVGLSLTFAVGAFLVAWYKSND